MLWQMGVAVGDFAAGFAFSTKVWSGIALAGLAVVLLVVSGPLRRRSVQRGGGQGAVQAGQGSQGGQAGQGQRGSRAAAQGSSPAGALARNPVGADLATRPAPAAPAAPKGSAAPKGPAKARKGKNAGDDDDDFGEVADILRRHGIT
jgi:hypothetical protein